MTERVFVAAGCFWGVQHRLKAMPGVASTYVGYARAAGSSAPEAECVRVDFDPNRLALKGLLAAHFDRHEPTRARPAKYRSAVYTTTPEQHSIAAEVLEAMEGRFTRPILTELGPAGPFREADERHQDWIEKRGARAAA